MQDTSWTQLFGHWMEGEGVKQLENELERIIVTSMGGSCNLSNTPSCNLHQTKENFQAALSSC